MFPVIRMTCPLFYCTKYRRDILLFFAFCLTGQDKNIDLNVDKTPWGALVEEEVGSSSEEEESDEEEEAEGEAAEGLETPSGLK